MSSLDIGADTKHRIACMLNDSSAENYMPFFIFIGKSFNHFMTLLQTSSPIIDHLYPVFLELIQSFLRKVIADDKWET